MMGSNANGAMQGLSKTNKMHALSNFQEYVTQDAFTNPRKLMMSSHSNEATQEDIQHFDSLQYMTQKITSTGKLGKKAYKPILH